VRRATEKEREREREIVRTRNFRATQGLARIFSWKKNETRHMRRRRRARGDGVEGMSTRGLAWIPNVPSGRRERKRGRERESEKDRARET
jgi:hypothetical protein